GALVAEIDRGGAAARAGLQPGDVIVSFEGRGIERASELSHAIAGRRPGDEGRLGVLRARRSLTVVVLLDRLAEAREPEKKTPLKGALGLRTSDAQGGGARVDAVDPESLVADELHTGDVVVELNRAEVRGAADLDAKLARAPRPSTALLRVRRGG